jgi:hypothetical protein
MAAAERHGTNDDEDQGKAADEKCRRDAAAAPKILRSIRVANSWSRRRRTCFGRFTAE